MVSIMSLWMPILLAAVLVFVASSVIHMFLGYHANDHSKVPDEDGLQAALRGLDIPPGEYVVPHAGSMAAMKSDEFQAKVEAGPVALLTVYPKDNPMAMGPQLAMWFVYCIVIAVFAAYVTGRTLTHEAEYLSVFRVAGAVSFAGYALGGIQRSIWYRQAWSTTMKNTLDGFLYALLTAGAIAGFWPQG